MVGWAESHQRLSTSRSRVTPFDLMPESTPVTANHVCMTQRCFKKPFCCHLICWIPLLRPLSGGVG